MIAMLSIYIPFILSLHMFHEKWNCDKPRKFPKGYYSVCEWDEHDIYKDADGEYHPYPRAKEDNYFERKARIRYWQKRQRDRR